MRYMRQRLYCTAQSLRVQARHITLFAWHVPVPPPPDYSHQPLQSGAQNTQSTPDWTSMHMPDLPDQYINLPAYLVTQFIAI